MAKNKLMLNNEWQEVFCGLPEEQAGKLIKALFACHSGEQATVEDPILSAVYNMMAVVIAHNRDAYDDKCRRMQENGKMGGRPKTKGIEEKPNETKRFLEKPNETKQKQKKPIEKKRIEENRKEKNINNNNMSGKPDGTPLLMPTVKEVVDYLNVKAGTHYRVNVKQTADKIKARLNDGFTIDDMKKVIDIKTAEWMGTEWQKFIRPETLFGAKFESYLNQRPTQKKNAAGKFANFEQRNDPEHNALVAKLIAMQ